ncbi:MAG: polysaccharide biosynthesis protein [Acidobacteriaceae bacterium]
MKKHLTNAFFGAVDYISYPAGMLLVAPIVLHRLGASEYGLWMVATAIISAGGIVASGFCDAGIQRVARLRGSGDRSSIADTVRSILAINLVLGSALAAMGWIAAPWLAPHLAASTTVASRLAFSRLMSSRECLISLRIASVAILARAVETVGVSTLRGFEEYRDTVQVSSALRLVTLGGAAVLALLGKRTISILLLTAILLVLGAWVQFRLVRTRLGPVSLWPRFHTRETRLLLGTGSFVWLQALGSVIFGQLDRILLGVTAGALVVAPYALCVQFAQPVFGLVASGLHFLFPYLSGRAGALSKRAFRQTIGRAFACNLLLVAGGAAILLAVGPRLIRIWAGAAVAHTAAAVLPPIVFGSALMGLSVTGTYAMQALGLFRTVALLSIAGRAAMLPLLLALLHHHGLHGLADSRLIYGAVALIVYLPLLAKLRITRDTPASLPVPYAVQEGRLP